MVKRFVFRFLFLFAFSVIATFASPVNAQDGKAMVKGFMNFMADKIQEEIAEDGAESTSASTPAQAPTMISPVRNELAEKAEPAPPATGPIKGQNQIGGFKGSGVSMVTYLNHHLPGNRVNDADYWPRFDMERVTHDIDYAEYVLWESYIYDFVVRQLYLTSADGFITEEEVEQSKRDIEAIQIFVRNHHPEIILKSVHRNAVADDKKAHNYHSASIDVLPPNRKALADHPFDPTVRKRVDKFLAINQQTASDIRALKPGPQDNNVSQSDTVKAEVTVDTDYQDLKDWIRKFKSSQAYAREHLKIRYYIYEYLKAVRGHSKSYVLDSEWRQFKTETKAFEKETLRLYPKLDDEEVWEAMVEEYGDLIELIKSARSDGHKFDSGVRNQAIGYMNTASAMTQLLLGKDVYKPKIKKDF